MKPSNPFLVRGYAGPEFFCDRAAETASLVSSIENDRDVTLIAPRRYGKTGLVHNVFHRLRGRMPTVYETPSGWIVYDRFFGEWLARFAPPSPLPRKRAAPRSRSKRPRRDIP